MTFGSREALDLRILRRKLSNDIYGVRRQVLYSKPPVTSYGPVAVPYEFVDGGYHGTITTKSFVYFFHSMVIKPPVVISVDGKLFHHRPIVKSGDPDKLSITVFYTNGPQVKSTMIDDEIKDLIKEMIIDVKGASK